MKVLNIEDTPIKHRKIRDVLEGCRITDIERVGYLDEGIEKYKEAIAAGNPYDLIITDMYYPPSHGADEARSGDMLVKIALEEKWDVPIIICSNQNYDYPEIFGTLYFSDNVDWEGQLCGYIDKLRKK